MIPEQAAPKQPVTATVTLQSPAAGRLRGFIFIGVRAVYWPFVCTYFFNYLFT